MHPPENLSDLLSMIKNEVQESIHLDYKDSRALNKKKVHEIAKDVSAFANSDGGVIVYGIREDQHLPKELDEGVDHNFFTREWLEEVISSNISPTIDGLRIAQIPLSSERSAFIIQVPKSYRAPHQEQSSKRYYKRYNFKSQPMEDYEIQDIRSRSSVISPLVNFDIVFEHITMIYFQVENIGKIAAENVQISFSKELPWRENSNKPPLLTKGIKYLPSGKKIRLFYNTGPVVYSEKNKANMDFDVLITYFHPEIGLNYTDTFHIDFSDYLHTDVIDSELYKHGNKIESGLKELTREIQTLSKHLGKLSSISSSTGLDISISSLRSLRYIISGQGSFDKFDPKYCPESIFREVLKIDHELAYKLEWHFREHKDCNGIEKIEGMTEEIIKVFKEYFIWNNS